jgi:hypothetical protein
MSIFDKFLHSVSYKFPKGYPDMSNPTDISLLESLISEVLGQSVKLNEGSIKQNTVRAIQTIISSELGKKHNFKIQSNWFRLGNMDKIPSDQFLAIIKDTFSNPQVTILKPKEGENPSSKYNMYLFDTPEGPAKIILSGGANQGEKYESNFYNKIKSSAGIPLEDITDPDLRELYTKIGIDPEDITPEQVIQTGNKDTKRPIDFNGPEDKGEIISDIIILPDTYLSIKNVAGSGFYNGGIIPFIVFEDGKVVYDPSKFNVKPVIAQLFETLNIDPKKVAQGLNEYATKEGDMSNTYENINISNSEDLKKFIASGYDYGYWYVREKEKGLFVYDNRTKDDVYRFVGDIKNASVKYPNKETKTLTAKLTADSPVLGPVNYLIEIRDTQGKGILPLSLKIRTT